MPGGSDCAPRCYRHPFLPFFPNVPPDHIPRARRGRSGEAFRWYTVILCYLFIHMPLQLIPSLVGSQLSEGSSTHIIPPWHAIPEGPPHGCFILLVGVPATHIPAQSTPSLVGSHLSEGSSMHFIPPGHWIALGPAQGTLGVLGAADSA